MKIVERALEGRDLDENDAVELLTSAELHPLIAAADRLRREQVGDTVAYVVNRNINFTNVCVKHCGFCAFSRVHRSDEAYFLDIDEIVRRSLEAVAMGATEVCLQAGLAPGIDGRFYIDLCRALKKAAPDLHLHAFSPEEVLYGSLRAKLSVEEFLIALREAGLGTLPGTSAEILDDGVREKIARGRISTADWVRVISTAHRLGIRTTSTIMFGHVESARDQARHLLMLRSMQRESGGFTELVPLSFVHEEAPIWHDGCDGMRAGPTGHEVIRLFAVARLILGRDIPNLQASWVKEGMRMAGWLLSCGANDLGGTLMNESISTTAGASHGQLQTPASLRRAIREAGRIPAERNTYYKIIRKFEVEPERADALDQEARSFGSYAELAADERFRFRLPMAK